MCSKFLFIFPEFKVVPRFWAAIEILPFLFSCWIILFFTSGKCATNSERNAQSPKSKHVCGCALLLRSFVFDREIHRRFIASIIYSAAWPELIKSVDEGRKERWIDRWERSVYACSSFLALRIFRSRGDKEQGELVIVRIEEDNPELSK